MMRAESGRSGLASVSERLPPAGDSGRIHHGTGGPSATRPRTAEESLRLGWQGDGPRRPITGERPPRGWMTLGTTSALSEWDSAAPSDAGTRRLRQTLELGSSVSSVRGWDPAAPTAASEAGTRQLRQLRQRLGLRQLRHSVRHWDSAAPSAPSVAGTAPSGCSTGPLSDGSVRLPIRRWCCGSGRHNALPAGPIMHGAGPAGRLITNGWAPPAARLSTRRHCPAHVIAACQ